MPTKQISHFENGIKAILIGIGLGIISGTFIQFFDLDNISSDNSLDKTNIMNYKKNFKKIFHFNRSKTEITRLSNRWREIIEAQKDLKVSAYLEIDDGRYAEYNSNQVLPAASTIKLPILISVLKYL